MKSIVSRASWVSCVGSAAIVAMIAVVGSVEAGQDPQARSGGAIQKGRETGRTEAAPVAGISGGIVAGIVTANPADRTACQNGTATACRAIEAGLPSGGAWSFVDGGISAMDDWERQSARGGMGKIKMQGRSAAEPAGGDQALQAAQAHRVLAACDAGDVSACSAFAASVRPATASERTETRTYTAGR